jgi:hypothetical protein
LFAEGSKVSRLGLARPQTLLQIRENSGQFAARLFTKVFCKTRLFAEKFLEYSNLLYQFAFLPAFFPRAVQSPLMVALGLQTLVVHHPILRLGCDHFDHKNCLLKLDSRQ